MAVLQRAWRWHRKRLLSRGAVFCDTKLSSRSNLQHNEDAKPPGNPAPMAPCMHYGMHDTQLHSAATKIQATARGWLARRTVACMKREAAIFGRRKRAARWRMHAESVQRCEARVRQMLMIWVAAEGARTRLQLKAQVRFTDLCSPKCILSRRCYITDPSPHHGLLLPGPTCVQAACKAILSQW